MDFKSKFLVSTLAVLSLLSLDVFAHGGRTNASGCHNDKKNGGYHCHGAKPASSSVGSSPVKATQSNIQKSSGTVYYKNCAAARAAGAAPVRSTDPGYGKHLDRDGDGIGCE